MAALAAFGTNHEHRQHRHVSRLYRDLAAFADSYEREGDTSLPNLCQILGGGAFQPTMETEMKPTIDMLMPPIALPCSTCSGLAMLELAEAAERKPDAEIHQGAKYCTHNSVLLTFVRRCDDTMTATCIWGLTEATAVACYNASMERHGTAPLERKQVKPDVTH